MISGFSRFFLEIRFEAFPVWVLPTLIDFVAAFIASRIHDYCILEPLKGFFLATAASPVDLE